MKKTRKLISVILAVILLFTAIPFALATDASTIEADIAYIKENGSWYLNGRCENFEEKLKEYATDTEKYKADIDYIYSEVDKMLKNLQDCSEGNHYMQYLSENCYPPLCSSFGYCLYCPYTDTVYSHSKTASHTDKDRDDICDVCGFELHYQDCGHICHNDSFIVSKILMPILMWFWDEFNVEEFCECGMYHLHYKSFL